MYLKNFIGRTTDGAKPEQTQTKEKRDSFYDKHSDEISSYESALKYLESHLNGYDKIPKTKWRTERDKLLAARYDHVDVYYDLREDIRNLEVLRRGAENIIHEQPNVGRAMDMEI